MYCYCYKHYRQITDTDTLVYYQIMGPYGHIYTCMNIANKVQHISATKGIKEETMHKEHIVINIIITISIYTHIHIYTYTHNIYVHEQYAGLNQIHIQIIIFFKSELEVLEIHSNMYHLKMYLKNVHVSVKSRRMEKITQSQKNQNSYISELTTLILESMKS